MLAINQLCAERRLSPDTVIEAVEAALISAYKRNFGAVGNIEVRIEPNTGIVRVYAAKEVAEAVQDPKTQVSLPEASRLSPGAVLGDTVLVESTPRDFGRIAAQTAKQVILQRIREAEREAQYTAFADSAGEIAHGTIQSVDLHSKDVIVNLDGAEAVLPLKEQVPAERYRRGSHVRAYVMEVRKGSRGPQITLSRKSPQLLRRLLELEVPEIANGLVEIKSIAREAGSRSKVAVHATQEGVDPVGSCVGVRGGRIQNVVNELGGEKIDIVQWDANIAVYIANALSPAKVMNVIPDDGAAAGKTATVIVPDRQLSLAIGKEGQNARLAAKLTGWRIDIKSATEAAEETLGRLEDTTIPPEEMDLLTLAEVILRKRGTAEASEEEKALLQQSLADGAEAAVAWPQKESLVGSLPQAVVDAEQVPPAVAAAPTIEELESAMQGPPADVEEPGADLEQEISTAEVRSTRPWAITDSMDEEPPYQPELVEGSIGWVQTETQENLYSGWQDEIEEYPGTEDEWEREELDEGEGPLPRGPKKKKKKKGGKSRYQRPHDEQ